MELSPKQYPESVEAELLAERAARREHLLRKAKDKFWAWREMPWTLPGMLVAFSGIWLLHRAIESGHHIADEIGTPMFLVLLGVATSEIVFVFRLRRQILLLVQLIEEEELGRG